MRFIHSLLSVLFFCAVTSHAQPVHSPKYRAEAEARWMQDSLHLSSEQMKRIEPILLTYQHQMDDNFKDTEKQRTLMAGKDHDLKAILDKHQFKIYYRREEQIRALPKRDPTAKHQPY